MPYICVWELGQHWFGWWLLACSAPIHYLNQSWLTINWTLRNKLQWNYNRNSNTFTEDTFENVVCNFHIKNGILYSYSTCIWSRNVSARQFRIRPDERKTSWTQWIYDSFSQNSPLIPISATAVKVTFVKKHPEASVLSILKLVSPFNMNNAACVKHFI